MKVCEIFKSIQGESSFAGYPFVFVRLSGCNLRCSYCDTTYAYDEGDEIPEAQLLKTIARFNLKSVMITGGEPLLQNEVFSLVDTLIQRSYLVLIETNGTIDISRLNKKAVKILDIKCPGSGETDKANWENLSKLTDKDEIKFVITNREDYEWAKWVSRKFNLYTRHTLNFSPAHSTMKPEALASWILQDDIPVRLNVQLQKYIWKNGKRGV
jgi:7-carboxy-7-deazaguanine synthase